MYELLVGSNYDKSRPQTSKTSKNMYEQFDNFKTARSKYDRRIHSGKEKENLLNLSEKNNKEVCNSCKPNLKLIENEINTLLSKECIDPMIIENKLKYYDSLKQIERNNVFSVIKRDYNAKNFKFENELKDDEVNELFKKVNKMGPFYSHCYSCSKKNCLFYDEMDKKNALELLKFLYKYK